MSNTFCSIAQHIQACLSPDFILLAEVCTIDTQSDKLQQTGQKSGRVFNSRSGCAHAVPLHRFETKLTNLKLKTLPKQLLGYLPLDIALNT